MNIDWDRPKTPAQAIERHAAWALSGMLVTSRSTATLQQALRNGSKTYRYMWPGAYVEELKQRNPDDYALLCRLRSEDFAWIAPWRVKQVVEYSKVEPTYEEHIAPYRDQYGHVPRGVR